MRQLYIHIGLGKTGSSALQSWLSINAAELARQDIAYADLSDDARAGKASSGNGALLVDALRDENYLEVERLLQTVYFPPDTHATGIISSELLKDIRPPKLRELHTLLKRLDIEPRIIAFVRSVYERAYSTYGQRVKMLGHTEPFDEGLEVSGTIGITLYVSSDARDTDFTVTSTEGKLFHCRAADTKARDAWVVAFSTNVSGMKRARPIVMTTIAMAAGMIALFGLGLIESIPDSTLIARANNQPSTLAGRTHMVQPIEDPNGPMRVGRFGWKGGWGAARHFLCN